MTEYTVKMTWREESSVWIAVNDEIPIALESDSFDTLVERVKLAAPELLELNGYGTNCVLHFVSDRREAVA
jgi:hypothetical protein